MTTRTTSATTSSLSDPVVRLCPAKVNMALSVGAPIVAGPRRGYHPIASWMVAVDLCDELRVHRRAAPPDRFDIRWADDAPQPSPIDWPIDADLAFKAHALLQQHTARDLPVDVTLTKRIPVGAGLAGGSSDGAAMLAAINDLFDLGLPRSTLIELAVQLGSDLAFFFGDGSAIVTGLGDELAPAPPPQPVHLALALPPLHCPTGAVYRAFDTQRPDAAVDLHAVHGVHAGSRDPFNDLAEPACTVEPRLGDLRRRLADLAQLPVHVTGSGAGLFIPAADRDAANNLAERLGARAGLPVLAVQSTPPP